jgi:hypothetical protein
VTTSNVVNSLIGPRGKKNLSKNVKKKKRESFGSVTDMK